MGERQGNVVAWGIGILLGIAALGQAVRPGSILHLDFVLLPHAPLPDGFWGLGTELPRRTPLLLPLTWLDPIIGSTIAGRLLVIACLAAAFVGASRMVPRELGAQRLVAGALYAANPFTMTRLAVGHLFVLAAMAVLPWVAATLLDPARCLRRTFRAALLLGLTGPFGGLLAGALTVTGLLGRPDGWRRRLRAVGVVVFGQIPWLVPGAIVWRLGGSITGSEPFGTDLGGPGGPLRVLAGHGFWQPSFQVGADDGMVTVLLGVALFGLAITGHRELPAPLGRLGPLALVALGLVLLSGWGAADGVYAALTDVPGGAVVREGQRLLVLPLLWLAPAVACSTRRWDGRHARLGAVAPIALVAVLVAPGIWGAGGQLRSVRVPEGWEEARAVVRDDPGPVLALPWFQYLTLDAAGGDTVLNPLPLWFGGDVLVASDPRLPGADGRRERNDPREPHAAALAAASLRGDPVSADLAALGVRWVAVLRDGGVLRGRPIGELHVEALLEDPGLRVAVETDEIVVFEVRSWRGPIVAADGRTVPFDPIVTPLAEAGESGVSTWSRPFATGWMRGWRSAHETPFGTIELPAGGGVVWYWPTAVVLCSYCLVAVAALLYRVLGKSSR